MVDLDDVGQTTVEPPRHVSGRKGGPESVSEWNWEGRRARDLNSTIELDAVLTIRTWNKQRDSVPALCQAVSESADGRSWAADPRVIEVGDYADVHPAMASVARLLRRCHSMRLRSLTYRMSASALSTKLRSSL